MAESSRAIAIIEKVMWRIEATESQYKNLPDPQNVPAEFQSVADHMPTLYGALLTARDHVQKSPNNELESQMKRIAEDCQARAIRLQKLFSAVLEAEPAERIQQYAKAVRELAKSGDGSLLEIIMESLLNCGKTLLTISNSPGANDSLRKIEDALTNMSEIRSSLEDDKNGFFNYGKGTQNINTGIGNQNNNNGSGCQIIGGSFSGMNPFEGRN